MRIAAQNRTQSQRGQVLIVMLAVALLILLCTAALAALGSALLGKGRVQSGADLAAISAARSMRDDFGRLFEPPLVGGRSNPRHLSAAEYMRRARAAALDAARLNDVRLVPADVRFPDGASFAPVRVRVRVRADLPVHAGQRRRRLPVRATAEAALTGSTGGPLLEVTDGGGYIGPFAYRQGKPMRPDVARAFDRMEAAARTDGIALLITSAYRSDAEQARLYARHPNPKWVAPPGHSLHRNATELDLGTATAYGWLERNAGRFHFIQRYEWERWHYETSLAPYRK